jgi:CRP-like cAMP-binding protein
LPGGIAVGRAAIRWVETMQRTDLIKAITDSAFFQGVAYEERAALAEVTQVLRHGEGETLFQPRQLPTALYLVSEGVVEISRRQAPEGELEPVAYRGPGAVLAESKVITGTPFNSLARFPEGGVTLQWPRPVILRRLFESRDLAMHYLQNLARRLEGTFANLGGHEATKLGGRLEHFDLPTILQTVVESGSDGVLEVLDARGRPFGAISTHDRRVGPIRRGALAGSEALFEILMNPPERGTFVFRTIRRAAGSEESLVLQPLLIEAARMQDELERFRVAVPASRRLRPTGRRLDAKAGEDRDLFDQIRHELATESCGWGVLAERLPYSHARVALAVRQLLRDEVLVEGDR